MGYKEKETGRWISSFEIPHEVDMQDVYETFWLEFEPLQEEAVMMRWDTCMGVVPSESTLMRWDEFGCPKELTISESELFWNNFFKTAIARGRSADEIIVTEHDIKAVFDRWLAYNSHRWEV